MSGFIYIMSNPSFSDGRIKIGKSKSDPSAFRKEELYSTGVPEPFEIEYFAFVEDHDRTEVLIHKKLDDYRPNKKREFFTCSIPSAILCIQQNSSIKFEEVFYKSPEKIEEEKRRKIEEANQQKKLEKMKQQKAQRLKDEENRNRQQRQKIEKENWEKKKKEFVDASILVVRMLLIFGLFIGILFLAGKFETKENTAALLIIVIILSAFCWYLFTKVLKGENTKQHKEKKVSKTAEPIDSRIKNRPIGYLAEVIIVCDNCGIKNKIPKEKLEKKHVFKPICAVCKTELKLDL